LIQLIYVRRLSALLPLLLCLAVGQTPSTAPQAPESSAVEQHLGKGYDALKQEQYQAAVDEFRAALAIDHSLVLRAQFPLAVALFEQHKSTEARREFEAVRRETGDHPNVLYYLGRLDIEDRDFASAINNLNGAMVKPPFPDTSYYLGFAYFKQGDLANAEKWLKQAAELNPRDSRISYQLGMVFRKEGRDQEAQEALAQSANLHRQDDSEAQLRTECAEKLDRGPRDEAHAICDKLYHDDDADRLTALGMIYGQHGDYDAALKPFARATELSPQSPQVQYNLALTYSQLGRFNDARTPLETALKRWPDLFPLNALYGLVLSKLGDDAGAYKALQHAHQLNPEDASATGSLYFASLKLADQAVQGRQDSKALDYLKEASTLRPQEAEPHHTMSQIYQRLGKSELAEKEQQTADRLLAK